MRDSVSALMPVRNGIKYLPKVSRELNANSHHLDEILLINDGSTDGTDVFLQRWQKENDKIRVINLSGCGIIKALNIGLAHANSKWVARFDVDDIYSNDRIEKQLASIESTTVAVFSDYKFITQNGISLGLVPSGVFPTSTFLSLFSGNRTAHSSAMFNRDAALNVGGYLGGDKYIEDLSLWLRLSSVGSIRSIPEPLVSYRLNSGSITSNNRQIMLKAKDSLLQGYDIRAQFSSNFFLKIQDDFDNYGLTPKSFERKLILTKELINLDSLYGVEMARSLANHFFQKLLKSPACYSPAIQLITEQRIRYLYRKRIFRN